MKVFSLLSFLILASFITLFPAQDADAANAGYSEFYVPGDENDLHFIMSEFNTHGATGAMTAIISATAWQGSTTLYYDHWEDGYELDPNDLPGTADEIVQLNTVGSTATFQTNNVAVPTGTQADCNTIGTCPYDGRDRIITVGGSVTLSRASWDDTVNTVQAVAWEVYPVSPLLTTYIMPFGEDLDTGGLQDFQRVFTLIQATEGTTTVTVNYDGIAGADDLCDRNGNNPQASITLALGEVFLLDRVSACNSATLNTGTRIDGNRALQVQYIVGETRNGAYEIRGFSAFPRGFWSQEYYAPVTGFSGDTANGTDIYLFNPQLSPLTIDWETTTNTGTFNIPANSTVSFNAQGGGAGVPDNSGVYLKGSDKFWGVSSIDSEERVNDWGYSLVPKELLTPEHYLAWAPGSTDPTNNRDDSGVFVTSAQDAIQVYVDYDNNGSIDDTYNLNRLESQYIFDPNDGDMTNAHIWATGPYVAAYGQNPALAPGGAPAIDVGYTMLPNIETETVLAIEKATNPTVLPTAAGSQATYTLNITSQDYNVDDISVEDFLPPGWQYVAGTTTITRADLTTLSGASADPAAAAVTYRDTFPLLVYNGNSENSPTGTNWASNWIEDNDSGTAQSPTDGQIRAVTDGATNALRLEESTSQGAGRSIARIADLSTAGSPILSFDYRNNSLSANNDLLRAYVCSNASNATPVTCNDGGGWTEVFSAPSPASSNTSYKSISVDLSTTGVSTNSATFAVRFTSTGVESGEFYYVTNISLSAAPEWNSTQLGSLASNQTITIEFTAETTQNFNVGDVTRNYVEATGTRSVNGVTQTFIASDFVFNSFGDLQITKTSSGVDPLSPGDQYTYTVTVTNPAGGPDYTNVSIYDALPPGVGYVSSSSEAVLTTTQPTVRATEYYVGAGSFTGTAYNLTLNQDLSSNYFVIIQGSAGAVDSATNVDPNSNYAALTDDPFATGELNSSGANNVITLTRNGTSQDWVGVVTVVESLGNSVDGFTLLDVKRVDHLGSGTLGTVTSATAWGDINQVLLMGGFNGAGCDTNSNSVALNASCNARIWPTGSDTINWSRLGAGTLVGATSTVMAVEWNSGWTVQSVRVQGNNGGNGANAVGEYNTSAITSVARANTWVWGTGHTNDDGIGDAGEGVLITLGDGVNQNTNENLVAVGIEYNNNAVDFQVYAMTNSNLAVDYRFKTDGDTNAFTVPVTVDAAVTSNRMAISYNGQNGTGNAYPRPILSARYLNDTTVRLERRRSGQPFPAWVQGINFSAMPTVSSPTRTQAANNPPNFVSSSDAFTITAGNTLTLTFDVTVDNPLANGINDIVNTGSATATELPVPITASVTNIVNNPGAGSATVGDRIWLDSNGNGTEDVGEFGLANVEVKLRDDYGAPLATTYTDANGYYSFTGIPAGTGYYVQVTNNLPGGLVQTTTAGPVGNSTPKFNLIDGQNYTTADIGYNSAPGTTTVGDLVWSDANGNGVRDSGEAGLGGVSVDLWRDDGDGIWDPLLDTLLSTQISAADGSYLFIGVTADAATDDYFIRTDPAQAALTGYSATTSSNYYISNALSSSSYLNADFGYQSSGGGGTPTYSITDRLWFDVNADGNDGGGAESGIAGVTVNLLDASLNVVASSTTAADGSITFTGVPDGNYTLRVTDTANILLDYYGTTTAAISGDQAVTVSGGNVTGIDFGYNLTRSIGDTVFNDLNGGGVQDSGEPGISGVLVELDNGSCVLGSTCPTVTTNASGTYLFSGLTDGSYVVNINAGQSALSGFSLTTADDSGVGSPHTRNVVLAGGASQLGIDYGYQAAANRAISGTVWSDDNQDGVIDSGEDRLQNVTVDLVNSVGTVVATVTTDANGDYTFSGQASDTYDVRITDTNSVLTGYTETYDPDAGGTGATCASNPTPACDGEAEADTTGGNVTGLRFGYYIEIIPTLVTVTEIQAYQSPQGVVVEWVTGSEQGTVGFWLERRNKETKKFERINSEILPALALEGNAQGGTYQYIDVTAKLGEHYKYRLIEKEIWGTTKTYGPFRLTVKKSRQAGTGLHDGDFMHAGKHFKHRARKTEHNIDRKVMKAATKARRKAEHHAENSTGRSLNFATLDDEESDKKHAKDDAREFKRSFDGVTITVRNTGLIHVDAAQLATELGLDLQSMQRLIKKGRLKLTNRGEKVRWQAEKGNTGLSFYGEAIDSQYTLDNVYQLRLAKAKGKASRMRSRKAAPSNRGDINSFLHTEVVENNVFAAPTVVSSPEDDFWFDGILLEGNATFGRKSIDLPLNDVIAGQELVIEMNGYTDDQHEVEVYLNGSLLGNGSWSGKQEYVLTLPITGQLDSSGSNTLELVLAGTPQNIIYYNRATVRYERATRAVDDQLLLSAQSRGNIRVDGFSDDSIRIWDVTDPRKPVRLSALQTGSDGAVFYARFAARKDHRYLATAESAHIIAAADFLQAPEWRTEAEHLVITSRDLETSAQALVDYRNSSGIPSQLILIEDIYQAYNYGIANPFAIRKFLQEFAKPNNARYVVFAGSASLDYRDLRGIGDNFVPTLLTATPFGLFSCDTCLGDLDEDNFAEFIVSRIPATDNAGLLAYVEKLRAYESTNLPAVALLLADNNDPRAGDFSDDSNSLAKLLPSYYQKKRIYLDDYPDTAAARTDMFNTINAGVGLINYIGHGGLAQLSASKLLLYTDMGLLNNSATPLLTALTCSVNRFEIPGFASLGERLVMDSDGGAIAVWGPSGLSFNAPAVRMNQTLMKILYQRGQSRIGEAINETLRTTPDVPEYMLRIYNLIGDAAVQVQ